MGWPSPRSLLDAVNSRAYSGRCWISRGVHPLAARHTIDCAPAGANQALGSNLQVISNCRGNNRSMCAPRKWLVWPAYCPNVRELILRGYQPSDAYALSELLNTIDEYAGGKPGFLPAEVENYLTNTV